MNANSHHNADMKTIRNNLYVKGDKMIFANLYFALVQDV